MSDHNIDKSIEEKRKKLTVLSADITMRMDTQMYPMETRAKVKELQEKIEVRTKIYENQLLDEKIEVFEEVINLLKD